MTDDESIDIAEEINRETNAVPRWLRRPRYHAYHNYLTGVGPVVSVDIPAESYPRRVIHLDSPEAAEEWKNDNLPNTDEFDTEADWQEHFSTDATVARLQGQMELTL